MLIQNDIFHKMTFCTIRKTIQKDNRYKMNNGPKRFISQ